MSFERRGFTIVLAQKITKSMQTFSSMTASTSSLTALQLFPLVALKLPGGALRYFQFPRLLVGVVSLRLLATLEPQISAEATRSIGICFFGAAPRPSGAFPSPSGSSPTRIVCAQGATEIADDSVAALSPGGLEDARGYAPLFSALEIAGLRSVLALSRIIVAEEFCRSLPEHPPLLVGAAPRPSGAFPSPLGASAVPPPRQTRSAGVYGILRTSEAQLETQNARAGSNAAEDVEANSPGSSEIARGLAPSDVAAIFHGNSDTPRDLAPSHLKLDTAQFRLQGKQSEARARFSDVFNELAALASRNFAEDVAGISFGSLEMHRELAPSHCFGSSTVLVTDGRLPLEDRSALASPAPLASPFNCPDSGPTPGCNFDSGGDSDTPKFATACHELRAGAAISLLHAGAISSATLCAGQR